MEVYKVRKIVYLFNVIICLALIAGIAEAYDEVNVVSGGTIKGSIKISGTIPSDETIDINSSKEYCGQSQKADKYIVTDSKVKNVVVWLDQAQKGKKLTKVTFPIEIDKCKISPIVGVAFTGGVFSFKNDDTILHTLQLKLGLNFQSKLSSRPLKNGATIINVALPQSNTEVKYPIKPYYNVSDDRSYITVMSNTHSFMRGYVFVFDHPYATVSNALGAFEITDIPAGDYTLKIWHEGLGTMEKKITIKAGTSIDADFNYQAGAPQVN
jgi:hypothetical protein